MKIPLLILSGIETTINAWLRLDGNTLEKFTILEGKIIQLHLTGLELDIFMLPSQSGVQVLGQYPSKEQGGEVDAIIQASPMSLIKLGKSTNTGETLLKSDVEIIGDMQIAETFSQILREVDIDWEEILSKLIGDIAAHQTGKTVRHTSAWVKETIHALQLNSSEYIREESRMSPSDTEINNFMAGVDQIRSDIDRIEARIRLLKEQI